MVTVQMNIHEHTPQAYMPGSLSQRVFVFTCDHISHYSSLNWLYSVL